MRIEKSLTKMLDKALASPSDYETFALKAGITPKMRKNPPKYHSLRSTILKATLIPTGALLVAGIAAIPTLAYLSNLREVSRFDLASKRFDYEEMEQASQETFKALNSISYSQSGESTSSSSISQEFIDSINSFSSKVMLNYLNGEKLTSIGYSPLGLYSNLDLVSLGCSKKEMFASIFGDIDAQTRGNDVARAARNNFQISEGKGIVAFKMAAFMSNEYEVKDSYVEGLTSRRAEAYQVDFSNEEARRKIIEWASQYSDGDAVSEDDLDLNNPYTNIIYLSLFHFDSYWSSHFNSSNTISKDFYLADGSSVEADFMFHTTYSADFRYYDEYVSFSDYYQNGYSIEYFLPNEGYSILDIASSLQEEGIDMLGREEAREYNVYVRLSLPKFSFSSSIDFKDTLSSLGLADLFDAAKSPIDNVFVSGGDSFLQKSIQHNEFSLSEDGTTVTSLTIETAGETSPSHTSTDSMPMNYEAVLDHPFIYVLKDPQGIPVFMGYMADPSK